MPVNYGSTGRPTGSRKARVFSDADSSGASSSKARPQQQLFSGEQQNDEQLNQLHSQVSTLRNITIEIGHEVREQNRLLDGMGMDFDRAGSILSQTMKKLTSLTQSERGRNYLFYTVMVFLLIIVIFFVRSLF